MKGQSLPSGTRGFGFPVVILHYTYVPCVGVDGLDAGAARQALHDVPPHAGPVESAPARPLARRSEDPQRPHRRLVRAKLLHEVAEDGLEVIPRGHLQS